MTKKRSSEIFTLKMEIFPEIGPRPNFLVPPKFGARSPPMATLPRNSYNKVAYATGLNLPFLAQTSTSSRRSYMKHLLRVKITIIFSLIQLNLSLHYDSFVNPASTYTYYRPFILFHQPKVTETSYFL